MKQRRLPKSDPRVRALLSGAVGPEDGVDPRDDWKARRQQHRRPRPMGMPRAPGRKTQQLGHQVAETVQCLLAGETGDSRLCGLRVVSATPMPDASRFLITLEPYEPISGERLDDLRERLDRVVAWLRTEVASAITRKRAPALNFVVRPFDPTLGG